MRILAAVLGGVLVAATAPARADEPMSGTFTVTHPCAAYQSFRKGTNPGAVTVEPHRSYSVVAKNKAEASHYRIIVEGAEPRERWVSTSCGTLGADNASPGMPSSPVPAGMAGAGDGRGAGTRATHVLAMGWEPAFCTKHADKKECRTLRSGDFAATHLSLHGLWPQPRGTQYCNVDPSLQRFDRAHNWDALPEPDMSMTTLKRLSTVMPGVHSRLQRHEWIVHGTCYGASADSYFTRAAGLAEEVNASKVSQLLARHAGRTVSADDIRSAFDATFGAGAGARVQVSCSGRGERRTITELTLSLAGDVRGTTGLGDLMHAAQPISPGCPSGYVQPAPN